MQVTAREERGQQDDRCATSQRQKADIENSSESLSIASLVGEDLREGRPSPSSR